MKTFDSRDWSHMAWCSCAQAHYDTPTPRKIYSAMRLCTGTPGWTWVCENCGETGVDYTHQRPTTVDEKRFCELTGARYYKDIK